MLEVLVLRNTLQCVYAAWCVAGVTIICSASYGVYYRAEAPVRIYLFYLCGCFAASLVAILAFLITGDLCPKDAAVSEDDIVFLLVGDVGTAFACGVSHIASYLVLSAIATVQVYCLWTVWSFCEDVKDGPSMLHLHDLLDEKVFQRVRREAEPRTGMVGLVKAKVPGSHPYAYGALP
eukprot:CAMPEP_0194491978 /NCGR_PEP_ID=MMETSP0253-20130528/10693_1 /TAXON_ID=2966 /ORGANISM="Noctiluca scintillans" /LENGTH=177 /DNA_ID=CAMNT_0039332781 /DNA_START=160 /DNA_END=693 /DNA_ORIENTATION=-